MQILNGKWFGTIYANLFWSLSWHERSGALHKRFSESFKRSEPLAGGLPDDACATTCWRALASASICNDDRDQNK